MKIRTTLSPHKLEAVAKGLKKAAKAQLKPYTPENNAESELLRSCDKAFTDLLDSLQEDVAEILLDKDSR